MHYEILITFYIVKITYKITYFYIINITHKELFIFN